MDRLADLIKGSLDKHRIRESAEKSEILFGANRILNEILPLQLHPAKAYKLHNTILYVAVPHPAVAQEVRNYEESILIQIRKRFGEKAVSRIILKNLTID